MCNKLLTVTEAAKLLAVSYGTLLAEIHAGTLPAFRFGRRTYRIDSADLAAYVNARRIDARVKASPPPVTFSPFRRLDAARLRAAWRAQEPTADEPQAES